MSMKKLIMVFMK